MTIVLLLALAAAPAGHSEAFATKTDLKAIYDEMSSVVIGTMAAGDVAAFRSVIYTPDWSFTDAQGRHRTWDETRGAIVLPGGAPPSFVEQTIRKLTLTPSGATVTVAVVELHAADAAGAPRPSLDRTLFRDTWERVGGGWKLKSREQLGATKADVRDPDRSPR